MSRGLKKYPVPLSHPGCLQWKVYSTQDFPHTPLIWVRRSCFPQNSDRSLFLFTYRHFCKFKISFAAEAKLALVCSMAKPILRFRSAKNFLSSRFKAKFTSDSIQPKPVFD